MTSSSKSPFAASADALAFPAPADLDDAYENRKHIPKADIHMQELEQQSAAFRAAAPHAELDQPYGIGARQRYDLFWPAGGPGSEQGLLVIVHGGYWLAFSKDNFFPPCLRCAGRGLGRGDAQLYAGSGSTDQRDN